MRSMSHSVSAAATCQNRVTRGSASASRMRLTMPELTSRKAVDPPPAKGSTNSSGTPSEADALWTSSPITTARPDFGPWIP